MSKDNGKPIKKMSSLVINEEQEKPELDFIAAGFTVVIDKNLEVFIVAKTNVGEMEFDARTFPHGLVKYALSELFDQVMEGKLTFLVDKNETSGVVN